MTVKNAFGLFFILALLYVLDVFRIKNVAPELLLIYLCVCLQNPFHFITSLILGLLSAVFMCTFANRDILYTMAFVLIVLWITLICFEKITHLVAIIVFALYESCYYLVYYIDFIKPTLAFFNIVFPSIIYNSALYFILYFIVEKSVCRKKHLFLKEVI